MMRGVTRPTLRGAETGLLIGAGIVLLAMAVLDGPRRRAAPALLLIQRRWP